MFCNRYEKTITIFYVSYNIIVVVRYILCVHDNKKKCYYENRTVKGILYFNFSCPKILYDFIYFKPANWTSVSARFENSSASKTASNMSRVAVNNDGSAFFK